MVSGHRPVRHLSIEKRHRVVHVRPLGAAVAVFDDVTPVGDEGDVLRREVVDDPLGLLAGEPLLFRVVLRVRQENTVQ